MSLPREEVQYLLLDLLAPACAVDPARIAALATEDWSVLCQMTDDHRIGPMLHALWGASGAEIALPQDLLRHWKQSYRRAALRALRIEQTLLLIARLFEGAGITYAALKGAALAWSAYRDPALRTMRDLDILVPRDQAMAAYILLKDAGFYTPSDTVITPEFTLAHDKHFPSLFSPVFNINVEVHFRLTNHIIAGTEAADYHQPARLLARRVKGAVRGQPIAFLSPTDTLLHLMIHAAYDHCFSNGPLVLHDVALLVVREPIEWDRFWSMAAQGGWMRGCQLMFQLVEDAHGPLPHGAHVKGSEALPAHLVSQAARLTLCEMEEQQETRIIAFLQRKRTPMAWLRYVLARVAAPRHVVAAWGGVRLNSPALLWLYPWRAMVLVGKAFTAFGARDTRANAQQLVSVAAWLHGAPE